MKYQALCAETSFYQGWKGPGVRSQQIQLNKTLKLNFMT